MTRSRVVKWLSNDRSTIVKCIFTKSEPEVKILKRTKEREKEVHKSFRFSSKNQFNYFFKLLKRWIQISLQKPPYVKKTELPSLR